MATYHKIKDITKVKLLTQLLPERENNISLSSGCESWKCSFSSDDSLFGWSLGNRIVTIINTNHIFKQNTFQNTTHKSDNKTSFNIDCGHLVRSLNFACVPNLNKSTAFWHRSAVRKDIFLITGHVNGIIRVWDVISGKLLLQLSDHKDAVSDVNFISSNDRGLLVSTSFDGTVKIWDMIEDGNLYKTLKTDGKPIYSCCVSKDGNTLVTVGMSKIVNIWETVNFTIRLKLNGHHHNIVSCCFSPDGCLIATASWDTSVILWDAFNGNKLRHFCQMKPPPSLIFAAGDNGNFIRSLAFSPDGYHIATVADDGLVRIWDILNDNEPEAVGTITDGLCCSYSNSGKILTVGTRNGSVSIFQSHSCTKSLLFLCRLAVKKYFPTTQFNTAIIPDRLINFLNYKEWI